MTVYEIANPSDAITIESDDGIAAGLAITMISNGQYCINDEHDKSPVPMFIFGGFEEWMKEKGLNLDTYVKENAVKMAEALESVLYGGFSDRKIFESATAKMSKENALKFREEWNESKRSSMNNIGLVCQNYAKRLRKIALPDKGGNK